MREYTGGSLAELHIMQVSSAGKPHCLWLGWVGRRGKVERRRKDKAKGSTVTSEDSFLASVHSHFIHAHCLAWPVAVASLLLLDNVEYGYHHVSVARAVLAGKPSMQYNCWASSSSLGGSGDHFDFTSGYTCSMASSSEARSIFWNLDFPTLNSYAVDEKWSRSIPVADFNCWKVGATCNHLRRYLSMCCWIVSTHEKEIS